jgi:hypothetical protein
MRDFGWKGRSETGEAVEVGAEDVALQDEVGEFALALDADEAGIFQLFHVVGEGGGADGLGFVEAGAGRGAVASADLGEDFVAAGCGQGAGDERELAVGNSVLLRGVCGSPGRDFGPLRRDSGSLRHAGALVGHALLWHRFLPYRAEAGVCWGKLTLRQLTYILLLHTVKICRALSASPRSVVAVCCAGFGWSTVCVDSALTER